MSPEDSFKTGDMIRTTEELEGMFTLPEGSVGRLLNEIQTGIWRVEIHEGVTDIATVPVAKMEKLPE